MAEAAVLPSVHARARDTISSLFSFIDAQGQGDYIGEAVSQLEHSLQTAYLAQQAGADDETVLGALLHDVGRFIPAASEMPAMIAPDGTYVGTASHEILGENYLRQLGFSEKVCQLVGSHVMAKRYLTAVDKGYHDGLSQSSKTTLKYQGGTFTPEQVKEAQKDPWLQEKLAVRRWDDQAKEAGAKTPDLKSYEPIATKCLMNSRSQFQLHGRTYNLPTRPSVVVCVDGFDPEYLQQAIKDGVMPNLASFVEKGFHVTAEVAMPTFTNTNNVSIITGAEPAVHGINGNYFLDRETHEEIMIQDDRLLRGSTILEQMSKRGVRVAAVTAKNKLAKILEHGLDLNTSICFSSEFAASCSKAENGIDNVEKLVGREQPDRHSGELSIYVLDAGVQLLKDNRADLFYLTLSDYIQHKHAPGEKESDELYAAIDKRVGELVRLGAVVAITGDHGMSSKSLSDGKPNVLFLEDELESRFGKGCCRVICPITDPFARHHAGLGSFVRVYVEKGHEQSIDKMIETCGQFPQVELVLSGPDAAKRFAMPEDREGDFVIVTKKNAVIGASAAEHDLSNLEGHSLRSHGGLSELHVPLIRSEPLRSVDSKRRWRNFDAFDIVLNY
ncbi:Phosphonoacetate hydrolase [Rhizodiscina lignyota]|uniref:Phosphonoacetate hydrolase n=1 Tax=Rhizodiscina lignyota TaxID=1504668 RepID=A0A9P4IN19_9PEZI|nr:Phosphonoacetate hydrolase [Rhizodiscina lignyota]